MRGKRRRDVGIEFFRIIGCVIVIAVHLHLDCWVDGMPDKSRIFWTCLCCDGVGIFWFICGAFLFKNIDYKKVLKQTWNKIVIPVMVFSAVMFYFRGFLLEGLTFRESIFHSVSDYKTVLDGILGWYNPIEGIGHLWYIYVYILIMVIFPFEKYFIESVGNCRKKHIKVCCLIFLLFVVNDYTNNVTFGFSHHSLNAVFPAVCIIIIGHYVYKYKEIVERKWPIGLLALGSFVGVNIIRMNIVYNRYMGNGDNTVLVWYSSLGILSVILLFIFTRGVLDVAEKLEKIIVFLGDKTFYIYLVHRVILDKLNSMGVGNKIYDYSMKVQQGAIGEFLYMVLYTGIIFLMSLLIVVIVNFLFCAIKNVKGKNDEE